MPQSQQLFAPGPRTALGKKYDALQAKYEKKYNDLKIAYDQLKHKYNELKLFDQGEQHYRKVQTSLPQITELSAQLLHIHNAIFSEGTPDMDGNLLTDLLSKIHDFAPQAEQFLEGVISGEIPGASLALRAKYASLHLARCNLGPVTKTVSFSTHLTRDDIEKIKERSISAMRESQPLVAENVEFTQIETPSDSTESTGILPRLNHH
jgi:hypothetical protein